MAEGTPAVASFHPHEETLETVQPTAFHEKAGECQVFSLFFPLFSFFFISFFFVHIVSIEPSRLCRHPSIRTLC